MCYKSTSPDEFQNFQLSNKLLNGNQSFFSSSQRLPDFDFQFGINQSQLNYSLFVFNSNSGFFFLLSLFSSCFLKIPIQKFLGSLQLLRSIVGVSSVIFQAFPTLLIQIFHYLWQCQWSREFYQPSLQNLTTSLNGTTNS